MVKTEPARVVAGITAFLTAVLGLVAAFGLPVSDDQRNAILGIVAPTVVMIGFAGEIIRSRVTPTAKAEQAIDQAYVSEPGKDPKPTLANTRVA